tara:strand:+ start:228 stop:695 length:468 start_codon:yes stop_codon:yes gene_type:complete
MVQTREERLKKKRESDKKYKENNKDKIKEYNQNNKEQIAEYKREYYQNNKEHIAEKYREYYENNKEHLNKTSKEYSQTPAGKKAWTMDNWRRKGVKNVNEEMYNHYIAATHCECCSKEFSSSRDRHLDHDHITGEFRWVICCRCNSHDNWKKIIG